jgi:hypothetical protein
MRKFNKMLALCQIMAEIDEVAGHDPLMYQGKVVRLYELLSDLIGDISAEYLFDANGHKYDNLHATACSIVEEFGPFPKEK